MIKFLHAADVHLDSPLRGLENYDGAPADRIRLATRRAFENLIELAIAEEVDFVLLAGDLYDGDWPDYNTGLYLVRQMNRLREAQIRVFVIAGNHDAENKMTRQLTLPDNVTMLRTDRPESLRLDDLGIAIHGQGFSTQKVIEDLSRGYPPALRGRLNIGLLHTCAGGDERHGKYAPCTIEGLKSKEYDYWALGHVHTRQTLIERPYVAFPGNVQGRHARETSPKGCLLVTVDGLGPPSVAFRRLDVVRWEVCEIDATSVLSEEELGDLASARLTELLAGEHPDRLLAVRVVVRGASPIHDRLLSSPDKTVAEVQARASGLSTDRLWIERVKIQTRPRRATGSTGDGPIEELTAVLEELRSDESRIKELGGLFKDLRNRLPQELLEGPEALALDDPAWLRELLDSAESLLLARLHS
ncbi:metallophosphoesterase family protein [Tundrisphaera lichenicola]|uniref:metallophosphoesterase family protein n=1 Tax=Tundrisphaera lichenicola TaxID=2029860 RepID=UPI003EB8A45E